MCFLCVCVCVHVREQSRPVDNKVFLAVRANRQRDVFSSAWASLCSEFADGGVNQKDLTLTPEAVLSCF